MSNNQKLLTGTIEPIDAEFVGEDGKAEREIHLNLNRSKRYAKKILGEWTAQEALEFLNNQILTKNLLINDQILALLEDLESAKSWAEKIVVSDLLQKLTAISTEITQSKIALDKALGMGFLPHLPETASNPNPRVGSREVSPEDFMKAYNEAASKAKQPVGTPPKTGEA